MARSPHSPAVGGTNPSPSGDHRLRRLLVCSTVWIAAVLAGCDAGDRAGAAASAPARGTATGFAGQALDTAARVGHYVVDKAGLGGRTSVTPPVRYVRFEVLSEINGGPWASIAEFNLLDESGRALPREAWKASADSTGTSDFASLAIDGDPNTLWHTRWEGEPAPMPHRLSLDLGEPHVLSGFRLLPRQDKSRNGSVARYRLYVSADGNDWGEPVDQGTLKNPADPLGERTVVFARQPLNHAPAVAPLEALATVRDEPVSRAVEASDADGDALAFSATGLPPGIAIDARTGTLAGRSGKPGRYAVVVQVEDARGAATAVPFEWKIVEPPPLPEDAVRFVRLEAVSEVHGGAWTSVAEFNLLDDNGAVIPREGWKATADSEAHNDVASNAIDGNEGTVWHTMWDGDAPRPPHTLTIDLGRRVVVNGFRYLPRQDGTSNGTIAQYRFFTSKDGKSWGEPVVTGDFSTLGAANAEKTVYLR